MVPHLVCQRSRLPESFISLFDEFNDFLLVDLQYGDTSQTIQKWKALGITVYHNDKINPLKIWIIGFPWLMLAMRSLASQTQLFMVRAAFTSQRCACYPRSTTGDGLVTLWF